MHQVYQKVHNFCVLDLGGFYLDIIKDRQYTTQSDGLPRRSAQTALYYIVEAFTRWIAPILSFTADELWPLIPGDRSEPVFTAHWYPLVTMGQEAAKGADYWAAIASVKNAVNRVLEAHRGAGDIGGSLDAEVVLYCDGELRDQLSELQNELRFVLITSSASVAGSAEAVDAEATEVAGLSVAVRKSTHDKCGRCWHKREDVGVNLEHPELCGRCVDNVAGVGEVRHFA